MLSFLQSLLPQVFKYSSYLHNLIVTFVSTYFLFQILHLISTKHMLSEQLSRNALDIHGREKKAKKTIGSFSAGFSAP